MRQAYSHIEPGSTYYNEVKGYIQKLVKGWNDTHNSKADPQIIFDNCKRIFKYHKWITIDDIEPSIDLGLMGHFGENKGLNSETIFKWFTGYSNSIKQNELKSHSAYQVKDTFISHEQRKETRKALIEIFINFYTEYQETKALNPKMNHYIEVFFRWFRKLNYIDITDEKELQLAESESESLRSMRTLFSRKPDSKETNTMKSIFFEAFKLAANNNYPIEEQLINLN